MANARQHACDQEGCTVADSATCMEGLSPEKCSHHSWLESTAAVDETAFSRGEVAAGAGVEPARTQTEPTRDLHPGDALALASASVITVASPARLVVMAGDKDSGKTTLLTSVYEKFLSGPFARMQFLESLTLPGFEERNFYARIDSGLRKAAIPRTPISDGFRVLHLSLAPIAQGDPHANLLLGDLSGELYRLARETMAGAVDLHFLKQADVFCLLLDGEGLANPRERQRTFGEAEGTLRSLLEANMIGSWLDVDIVCSKWDLVYRDEAATNFVDERLERLRAGVKEQVASVRLHRVAALPHEVSAEVPPGFGTEELLAGWARVKPQIGRVITPMPRLGTEDRECSRFADRYPAEVR